VETDEITDLVEAIAARARGASLELATLPTETKNAFLEHLADALVAQTDSILTANRADLEAAEALELPAPMVERLTFSPERIAAMAEGVRQVAALPDPVGTEIERLRPPRGFDLRKIRVPIGVIGIIYESRPNVTPPSCAAARKPSTATPA